jgi:Tfp pilus assembly protein PilO
MKTPLRRILAEKRRLILPVVVLLLMNLGLYAVAVYPLALRVQTIEARAGQATAELASAEQALASVRAVEQGKSRASEELHRFYTQVLPADLAGARRITYLRLAQLAEQSGLQSDRRSLAPSAESDRTLERLQITMVLEGNYEDVRSFIHQLETSPEFVVIDDVTLTEGADEASPLILTLQLSTYFPSANRGS